MLVKFLIIYIVLAVVFYAISLCVNYVECERLNRDRLPFESEYYVKRFTIVLQSIFFPITLFNLIIKCIANIIVNRK